MVIVEQQIIAESPKYLTQMCYVEAARSQADTSRISKPIRPTGSHTGETARAADLVSAQGDLEMGLCESGCQCQQLLADLVCEEH